MPELIKPSMTSLLMFLIGSLIPQTYMAHSSWLKITNNGVCGPGSPSSIYKKLKLHEYCDFDNDNLLFHL